MSTGKGELKCGRTTINVNAIAPDLSFSKMEVISVEYSAKLEGPKLGKGSFAEVFLGEYNGNKVLLLLRVKECR